jgi:hypothetical protein
MAHRIGVCQSCRARFQIPASFAPNRAKCRNCGGVVQIGPAEGAPAPGPVVAPSSPPRAPEPRVQAPARAPEPASISPKPPPAPAIAQLVEIAPERKGGLKRVLLVAGIAAALAIGSWLLFA